MWAVIRLEKEHIHKSADHAVPLHFAQEQEDAAAEPPPAASSWQVALEVCSFVAVVVVVYVVSYVTVSTK